MLSRTGESPQGLNPTQELQAIHDTESGRPNLPQGSAHPSSNKLSILKTFVQGTLYRIENVVRVYAYTNMYVTAVNKNGAVD